MTESRRDYLVLRGLFGGTSAVVFSLGSFWHWTQYRMISTYQPVEATVLSKSVETGKSRNVHRGAHSGYTIIHSAIRWSAIMSFVGGLLVAVAGMTCGLLVGWIARLFGGDFGGTHWGRYAFIAGAGIMAVLGAVWGGAADEREGQQKLPLAKRLEPDDVVQAKHSTRFSRENKTMLKSEYNGQGVAFLACALAYMGLIGDTGNQVSASEPTAQSAVFFTPTSSTPSARDGRLKFYLPTIRSSHLLPYRIDSIQLDGAIRGSFQCSDQDAAKCTSLGLSVAIYTSLTEGHLLGLKGWPLDERAGRIMPDLTRASPKLQSVSMIRVQVVEVLDDGNAAFRVGPQAVSHLKTGDLLVLMRPPGSSTAQVQAAPDIVEITDTRGEVPGMDSRMAVRLIQSKTNLKQIGMAMHRFHDRHKCFPPAVIFGPDGKPWHSWRVLLLPYVGQLRLYEQYKFNEPWDGPNNKHLLEKIPAVYRDPVYGEADDSFTHYAVAVGEGTAFRPKGHQQTNSRQVIVPGMGVPLRDFRDGSSNTLLVGSVSPDRKIPWTKPEDIAFDVNFPGIGKDGGFASPYRTDRASGGVFLRADGSVITISTDVAMEVLRNLLEIDDRNRISEVPALEPTSQSRLQKMAVIEIQDTPNGPTAELLLETLKLRE